MRIIFTLLLMGCIIIQGDAQGTKAQQMEEFADSIDFVSLSDYINGGGRRSNYVIGNVRLEAGTTPVNLFTPRPPSAMDCFTDFAKTLTMPEIEVFLKDKSPKVRGLALLAAYQLEDQKALLRYADFLGDSAVFLKARPYQVPDVGILDGPMVDAYNLSQKDMLVADIAKRIISEYMSKAGYVHFDDELPQFLQERQNLDYTLGFFMLMSKKALGHAKNSSDWEGDSMVVALKARINNLPNKIDAAIYKLYIPVHDKMLFNETERLEALRFLGKQHAKEILEGVPPTKDPDLNMVRCCEHSPYKYHSMCKWILKNASVVFDRGDIGYLLERAEFLSSGRDTTHVALDFIYWHIACASLDSANASKYLKDCLLLQTEDYRADYRALLYAELWNCCGQSEVDAILDWFFGSYRLNEKSLEHTTYFIDVLEDAKDTMLIKHIIADHRFEDSITIRNTIQLAYKYNKLVDNVIIPYEITDAIDSSYDSAYELEGLEAKMENAIKNYPAQTKNTLEKTVLKNELRKLL